MLRSISLGSYSFGRRSIESNSFTLFGLGYWDEIFRISMYYTSVKCPYSLVPVAVELCGLINLEFTKGPIIP
jgi:hypothetical protein